MDERSGYPFLANKNRRAASINPPATSSVHVAGGRNGTFAIQNPNLVPADMTFDDLENSTINVIVSL
jgi:hypothetical protein